jgi:transcriptional regulator GlxA family with amidase domain
VPSKRFVIVIFDGMPIGILSFGFGVFEVGKYFGVLPGLDVSIVAGEPGATMGGGGLSCQAPYDLGAIRDADVVIVPEWRHPGEDPPSAVLDALLAAHDNGAQIVGMCSGTFVLAAAGLLEDRPATTHWALADVLARRYPAIDVRPGVLYVDDGDVLTAGGGAAGMDLGLHLIRAHLGGAVANRVARFMVVPPHRAGGQAQYIESPLPETDETDPVGETMHWALARIDQALSVDRLARHARMSRRNFARRFREITGATPAAWVVHQRVLHAQQLLESTDLPVEVVAKSCGFLSAAAMRPHFKRLTGAVPAAYRSTFSILA